MKLPQKCPNPECEADLTDHSVPPDKVQYQDLFSLVKMVPNGKGRPRFMCPVCSHTWILGSPTKKARRSGNPAKRGR